MTVMKMSKSLLIVVCLVGLAFAQTIDNCPTSVPRDQYTVVFGNQCFQFVLYRTRDYPDALKDCQSRDGTLALTKTKAVEQFLQTQAVTYGLQEALWIGLNDKATENTFVWEDGTALDEAESNWSDDEGPRTGIIQHNLEDCVATNTGKNGQWEDYHCDNEFFGLINYEKHYICSFDLIPK
ncbi:unnamed protein product [Candidula unifasciata]|uniref:C-type lectin domain-containing protein n=1 Tax=Candidula unifasciata TaxID=100452 RepID=A0A8S3ZDI5_9EUPU|nr:unnamed protein product [Candidula unifasciata]